MNIFRHYADQLTLVINPTNIFSQYLTDLILVLSSIFLSWLAYQLCQNLIVPIVTKITQKTENKWDDILLHPRILHAACLIVPAIVTWICIPGIFSRYPFLMLVLERITAIYITLMSMRLALAVVDALGDLDGHTSTQNQQYLHTFCGVLRLVIACVCVIIMVAILIGKSPLTLFAGLGATSAVLMLVFKDTISGLVAGLRLTSNQMLQRGDWITVDKAGINGIVEDITLTTVKVRNFDNTILTVTPQTLVDDSFQNWKGMQQGGGRRVLKQVHIDFSSICIVDEDLRQNIISNKLLTDKDIPANTVNLTLFRIYANRYIETHPLVNPQLTHMVRTFPADATGLPLQFYFFTNTKEWTQYEYEGDLIMDHLYATIPLFRLRIYQRV